jgi:transcriptional regulator with XRE-family HTH domain
MRTPDFAALIAGLESAGMTRGQIAASCHLSRNTVWRLATGEMRAPSYSTIQKIEALYVKRVSRPPGATRRF